MRSNGRFSESTGRPSTADAAGGGAESRASTAPADRKDRPRTIRDYRGFPDVRPGESRMEDVAKARFNKTPASLV